MTERHSPQQRSFNMSRVLSRNTLPERKVRQSIHALGLRYRLHRSDLPGTPDLVFPGRKIALFVHGCFWHRHADCPKASTPLTRPDFWRAKFEGNVKRDLKNADRLRMLGWRVEVIWECETFDEAALAAAITRAMRTV